MNSPSLRLTLSAACLLACALSTLRAHDVQPPNSKGGHAQPAEVKPVALPYHIERTGPVTAPKPGSLKPGTKVTGQGFWTFADAPGLVPIPAAAAPHVAGAHGTVMFDPAKDTVYWGLRGVGFVAFSNGLTKSWVVQGHPALAKGNIHGADLLQRSGKTPLVVAADNEEGQVHVTDGTFQKVDSLGIPPFPQYADRKGFAPTDATFLNKNELWVTDGYGKAYFMPATLAPLAYGKDIYGGKSMSETPHGITYDRAHGTLLISARAEGRIITWDLKKKIFQAIDGLPSGSTVCDVDIWGDYVVAPCLHDHDKTKAGPIFIVNLKKKAIVATLRPKDDLGIAGAQSIHGACWYFTGKGKSREVYIVHTPWNPGGIGALKLVGPTE